MDGEIVIDPHRRDRTHARLSRGIDGGEHGELRVADDGVGQFVEAGGIDGFGAGFHGGKSRVRIAGFPPT